MNSTKAQKIIDTSLELGGRGYVSARPVDKVVRFEHSTSRPAALADMPTLDEMLRSPKTVPLLMTEDGTLWQPAELGTRLLVTLRAVAETVGMAHDAPLEDVYRRVCEALEARGTAD